VDVVNSPAFRRPARALTGALLAGLVTSGCAAPAPTAVAPAASTVPPASPASSRPAADPTASATPTKATPRPTASTAPALRVSSVENFRDVAGDGLRLSDGAVMATGVVYRSAKLATISGADLGRLRKAGLALVIDLRTTAVASRAPDPGVRGARHELVNIYGTATVPPLRDRTVPGARAYMRGLNVGFVTNPGQRARIARALKLIASAKGPVVIHCSEGKDRTGWVSAVLQLAAGAEREDVVAEYLKSNEYRADVIAASYRETAARAGVDAARVGRALLTVDASYLEAGLDELEERYGDIDGYLTRGLGLSDATIARLRSRLTA
jgi:protein-tyrosine phosphatase